MRPATGVRARLCRVCDGRLGPKAKGSRCPRCARDAHDGLMRLLTAARGRIDWGTAAPDPRAADRVAYYAARAALGLPLFEGVTR